MGYGTPNGAAAGGENLTGQTDLQFGQSQVIVPDYAQNGGTVQGNVADNFDYSKMQHISNRSNVTPTNGQKGVPYGFGSSGVVEGDNSNISIELGADGDVSNLEEIWGKLSSKYSDVLGGYTPFFSVDAPADGQGKELFHLRVGPVKSLDAGDKICGELGRSGVFCSVVRVQ
jgi:hypothetical protein